MFGRTLLCYTCVEPTYGAASPPRHEPRLRQARVTLKHYSPHAIPNQINAYVRSTVFVYNNYFAICEIGKAI